jgi:hypothetical protein
MNRTDERRLLRLMALHGIGEFSCSDQGDDIALSLAGLTPLHPEIRARQAGRFLGRHPSSDRPAHHPRFVHKGEIVAWLSIGALLVPVVAEEDAMLPAPLCADGDIVGYGQPLF